MTMVGDTSRRDGGPVVILAPSGRLDGDNARALEAELSAIAGCGARAVLDCGGIVDIGPAGLRALFAGALACLREGNELVLAAVRPGCRAVLAADGLWGALKCHDTVEAALDACARGGPGDGAGMRISQRQEGDTVVLSSSGQLDAGTAPVLINAISGALERLRAKRQPETGGRMQ